MSTLKNLINVAIKQEQNSQKLYQKGLDLAQDDETKKFFKRLRDEEVEHEKMLFNIRETELYDMDVEINDPQLLEMAQSSHGSDDLYLPEDLTIADVLEIAMKRENMARIRYEKAARIAKDDEVKELLKNLANEEENHRLHVEKYFKMHKGLFGEEI
ncbi:MAG: ferritin family protein [Caldisericaceae bacterium]|nr:ferritin family protein [Caldisericaceae bacterium]